MNVLRKIETSTTGKLVIDLPADFQNTPLEITIAHLDQNERQKQENSLRIKTVQKYKGIFKNSTYEVNEADWYEQ